MKRGFNKLAVLVLLISIMLCLEACGAEVQELPEPEPEPVPETSAEPLIYHVYEETEVLARETVYAVSALPESTGDTVCGPVLDRVTEYDYDKNGKAFTETTFYSPDETAGHGSFFNINGGEVWGYGYEYGPDGELSRVTIPAGEMKGTPLVQSFEVSNGRTLRSVITSEGNDEVHCEYVFLYDADGKLSGEEITLHSDMQRGYSFSAPQKDVYSFDSAGCLVLWDHQGPADPYRHHDGSSCKVAYEYDDAGLPVKKITQNSKGVELMEISRDENGRTLSTRITKPDGNFVLHTFSYDEAGRILSDNVTGPRRDSYLLEYNEDGYPVSMTIYYGGIRQRIEKYTYEQDRNGILIGNSKVTFNEADIFGGSELRFVDLDSVNSKGMPMSTGSIELAVAGTNIRYVTSYVKYAYKKVPILREAAAGEFEPVDSLEAFYPSLNEKYGAYPVPQPDGTELLRKITVSSNQSEVIDITTYIVMDQYGRPAGQIAFFDIDTLFDNDIAETDSQGRPVFIVSGNYSASYEYADDMRSYRVKGDIYEYAYHSEREYNLAGLLPAAVLAISDDSEFHGYQVEYSEGLLIKYAFPGILEYCYSYELVPDAAGKLSYIGFVEYSSDHTMPQHTFLSFDEHGYLTEYTRILEHEIITITYTYVEAG